MADEFTVFDDELKRQVREALELAKRARAEINRAQQAGLDVSELLRTLTENEQQLRRIQQVYGGVRRTSTPL
jgi:DNA-binding transcriptional regulator GbsR (MarR family)